MVIEKGLVSNQQYLFHASHFPLLFSSLKHQISTTIISLFSKSNANQQQTPNTLNYNIFFVDHPSRNKLKTPQPGLRGSMGEMASGYNYGKICLCSQGCHATLVAPLLMGKTARPTPGSLSGLGSRLARFLFQALAQSLTGYAEQSRSDGLIAAGPFHGLVNKQLDTFR
jgi:hypothetical protein